MKVLISGSFSTGKSGFASALARELTDKGVTSMLIPEVARTCPYPLNKAQTIETSMWLTSQQIKVEIEAEHTKPEIVICDRGLPDILSHALTVYNKARDARLFDVMISIMKSWSSTYDLVLWSKIDPEIPILGDSLRLTDDAYRRRLQRMAQIAFALLDLQIVELPNSVMERLNAMRGLVLNIDSHTSPPRALP